MIAATGELVGDNEFPEIYVWNIDTKDILARLKGFHTKAVRYVNMITFNQYLYSSDSRRTDPSCSPWERMPITPLCCTIG